MQLIYSLLLPHKTTVIFTCLLVLKNFICYFLYKNIKNNKILYFILYYEELKIIANILSITPPAIVLN